MKASPAEQKELLRLQAADTRLQQLAHTAKNLPQHAELAALAPQVDAVRQRFAARGGELEDARTELKRIESDVEIVEARITRDTGRVEHSASVKDVNALESELASLRKRRSDLEEIELGIMERIEVLETDAADIDEERAVLGGQQEALEAARATGQATIDAQLKALSADRATIAGTIPDELLALYEKQRGRYGTGAALLVRGVSMGSNVKLTESDLDDIRRAAPDDVVLCPDSGAILIRNEESGL
ncbi:MAG: uncharacterized protein QOD05_463 [Microbacteriaceae bacterium]|nr:uncharacterized protein [Microbacteriaceae bacterium]